MAYEGIMSDRMLFHIEPDDSKHGSGGQRRYQSVNGKNLHPVMHQCKEQRYADHQCATTGVQHGKYGFFTSIQISVHTEQDGNSKIIQTAAS